MGLANTAVDGKKTVKKRSRFASGTVSEQSITKRRHLQAKASQQAVTALLNNLPSLQKSHQGDKKKCFAKGIPFYTCIDAANNSWQKELENGSLFEVTLTYDWEKDQPIEKIVKQIH
ncbi:MAG: hypothetical protein WDO71_28855 [Bacteroidota bacterium]